MSYLLPYLNSLYKYSKKTERTEGGNFYMDALRGVFKMHPVFSYGKDSSKKLSQVKRTLLGAKLNYASNETFFYELDSNRIMICTNRVIDNMPVDYSPFVDSSLAELNKRSSQFGNAVSEQNKAYFAFLDRYIDELTGKIVNRKAADAIQSFKSRPAMNLYEALQRILFYHQIIAQTGHTLNGLGRLDKLLDRFELNEDNMPLIKEFMKALHKFYNFNSNDFLGDTGQLIILGGLDENGSYFYNGYTEYFIKALTELHLPDPKILLRSADNMPENLLMLASDCVATGIGSPLFSNDNIVIPSLLDLGYTKADAYNYGVSACWEPLSIGNSLEQNNIDCIEFGQVINKTILNPNVDYTSFDSFLECFKENLKAHIMEKIQKLDKIKFELDPVLTAITKGCLENGKDIANGGAVYNNYGILSVGLSTAVDSLINIRRYVFEYKQLSFPEVVDAIKNNYLGHEELLQLFSQKSHGFGTSYAVDLTNQIMDLTSSELSKVTNPLGGKLKYGLSSPTYIRSGTSCGATADGRLSGVPFATHISSSCDNAMTEVVNFASRLSYNGNTTNGNVADLLLSPVLLAPENRERFCTYLRGCIALGVYELQFNVVSLAALLDAKAHPEAHKDLIVRVWGFSAYFNDLPEEYKNVLIQRAREAECA